MEASATTIVERTMLGFRMGRIFFGSLIRRLMYEELVSSHE
jgi:hypothetical protein